MRAAARSRALIAGVAAWLGIAGAHAAPDCPVPPYSARAAGQLTDWYDSYLKPFRTLAGVDEASRPSAEQIGALLEKQLGFNRRGLRDPLYFEALTQAIAQHYARAPDFKGIDLQTARKIYRPGSGPDVDFSMICIDARTVAAPADAFGITLFGVILDECERIGLRGLVFTDTLVNGAANGQCRPDHVYYKMLVVPINAGTNTVTFLCRKDTTGCFRQ